MKIIISEQDDDDTEITQNDRNDKLNRKVENQKHQMVNKAKWKCCIGMVKRKQEIVLYEVTWKVKVLIADYVILNPFGFYGILFT